MHLNELSIEDLWSLVDFQPNDNQKDAILHTDGPLYLPAGPGSGKTRVPLSSLYKLAQSGKIPCQKVGRHWRFRREAIERWLEESPKSNRTISL